MGAAAAPPPALRIAGLSKSFGGVRAVDGVDLDIMPGTFFSILGASGSGKTTLLRLVAGFERPDVGRIAIGGADVTDAPPYARPLNMVFQSYALFPHLSVADNVAFGLRRDGLPRGEVAARVAEALALVELGGLERRRPDALSGGQRQRVALARALAKRPALVLLDEPLSALDRALRARTRHELVALQRRLGITFVMVTHDQEEAMATSDRLAVMAGGRIAQEGPPRAVYERPVSRAVATFLGDANLFDATVEADGRARADDGTVLAVGGAPPPGARIAVMVRPEAIAVHAAPPDADNVLAGTVAAVDFEGALRHLRVALPSGRMVQVAQLSAGAGDLAVGAPAWLSFPARAAVALPP
ncbi:MAG: ABC transporter ATP-binding protein [Rhodospirillales bacterium]